MIILKPNQNCHMVKVKRSSHACLGSDFDDKASDNPDISLGDNCSMNNTSDINDCISIDSDYEGVAFCI